MPIVLRSAQDGIQQCVLKGVICLSLPFRRLMVCPFWERFGQCRRHGCAAKPVDQRATSPQRKPPEGADQRVRLSGMVFFGHKAFEHLPFELHAFGLTTDATAWTNKVCHVPSSSPVTRSSGAAQQQTRELGRGFMAGMDCGVAPPRSKSAPPPLKPRQAVPGPLSKRTLCSLQGLALPVEFAKLCATLRT
jgi:hypothetical protein